MSTAISDHPLLDGGGPGWAATETRADVVALTVGMSDFLHRVATAGDRPIVVSGEHSRMTQPLAEALPPRAGPRGRLGPASPRTPPHGSPSALQLASPETEAPGELEPRA